MTRLIVTLVTALCICACATPGNPSVSDTLPVANAAQTVADTDVQEGTSATSKFDNIEPPTVKPAPVPLTASNANERVCRREIRTGTHRAVRVCRTRAEMSRLEEESKDTFRELHRSQTQEK